MKRPAAWLALMMALTGLPHVHRVATAAPGPGTPDPLRPGSRPVLMREYDAQVTVVRGDVLLSGIPTYVDRLRGRVHAPDGPARPGPVVVVVPGRHDNCRVAGMDLGVVGTVVWPCPDAPPAIEDLPSWRGFDYLGRHLASHGYVVAVINTNGVNSVGMIEGSAERSQLVSATLGLLAEWHRGARTIPDGVGDALTGRVDLSRVGLVGHSRGADGIGRFLADEQGRGSTAHAPGLRALLQIAGRDATVGGNPAPVGVHLGVLLGTCDADTAAKGTAPWERGRFHASAAAHARVHWMVTGASHNLFNSEWYDEWEMPFNLLPLGDEPVNPACTPTAPGNSRLTRADQEKVGLAIMSAFLRRYVGDERVFDPLMTGAAALPQTACATQGVGTGRPVPCAAQVRSAYIAPARSRTVLADLATARSEASFGVVVTPCTPGSSEGCPEPAQYSVVPQATVTWTRSGSLVIPLRGPVDLTRHAAMTLRAAMNPTAEASAGRAALDVQLVLRDAAGRVAAAPVGRWSHALVRPPVGSSTPFSFGPTDGYLNLTLHGARIPMSSFRGVDLARVTAVGLDLRGSGSLQLSDVLAQT